MQIIVPAESDIHDPLRLNGHTLVFTDRTSNSGFKAAVVLSRKKACCLLAITVGVFPPDTESIKGISAGEYEVAPVSREMLIRAVAVALST